MRQKDKVEKLLEDYPDVFADIINVLIYDGKQVISPKRLSETKVRSQYKAADSTLHEQERDILKVWKKGKDHKVIFGVENQTSTDKQIYANNYKLNVFEIAYLTEEQIEMFQSDFGIIADYFVKRRKGYKNIENHKPIKHVDEMLKFMEIFAEDERFLKLNLEKKKKGAITMCTILDAAEERGVNRGETLKLIMLVQKKV